MTDSSEQKEKFSGWNSMKPEEKKTLKTFGFNLIISAVIVLIIGLLLYLKIWVLLTPEEITMIKDAAAGLSGWGVFALSAAILFYIMGIVSFFYYRKKYKAGEITKDVSVVISRVLICCVCAWFASNALLTLDDIWYSVYVYLLAFSCTWIFFQLFSAVKYKTFKRILWFPLALVFRFFIPMMLVILVLLGSINGLFPHDPIFLNGIKDVFGGDKYIPISEGGNLGAIFGYGCYKVISTIYLIGESRPQFMFILCILTTIILLYRTIKKHFVDGVPPMSFIDEVTEKELKEYDAIQDVEMDKTKEQRRAELKAKEKAEEEAEALADENFKVKLY